MANSTKTATQIKSQIGRFSTKISRELDKPKRKFIHQMIYSIQVSKDVKLASVGRVLDEDIPLIKTADRLPRQIKSKDLTLTIGERLIKEGKPSLQDALNKHIYDNPTSQDFGKKASSFASQMTSWRRESLCRDK